MYAYALIATVVWNEKKGERRMAEPQGREALKVLQQRQRHPECNIDKRESSTNEGPR